MTRYERYDISASPGNKHLSLWRSPWWAADDHGPEGLAGVTYICSRRRHCGAQVSRVQCHCVSSGWSNCEWALGCKWVGAAEVKNRNYPDLNLIENRPKKILYYPIQTRKGWSWIRLTTLTTFQNSKHQMTMRRIHTKGDFLIADSVRVTDFSAPII